MGDITWLDSMQKLDQGILLLDHPDDSALRMKLSFRMAGFQGPIIFCSGEDFLPEDGFSPYQYFCRRIQGQEDPTGFTGNEYSEGNLKRTSEGIRKPADKKFWDKNRPRYFNEINRPDYWEVSGNNTDAEIHERQHLRARISYLSKQGSRLVRSVDWLDESGHLRSRDYYDERGFLSGRSVFDQKEKAIQRSWLDPERRECITENYVTGDTILNYGGKVYIFQSRTDFLLFFLKVIGAEKARLYYNSLSYPFFVSERLRRPGKEDVLFWQEEPRPDIPGNMQIILSGQSENTKRIFVQRTDSYKALASLGASEEVLRSLGFLQNFQRQSRHGVDVMISTNSDQIRNIREIVQSLPGLHFHIAAITEMSDYLLGLEEESNVTLYPGAYPKTFEKLFSFADYYLDINYGNEIMDSCRRAFENNMLLLGFSDTLHSPGYLPEGHVYDKWEDLAAMLRHCAGSQERLEMELELQRKALSGGTAEEYQKIFKV